MEYDLSGKSVIVTGGATGIGFACAKELLCNGVKGITIADINTAKGGEAVKELTDKFGPSKAIFVQTDVTKADELEAAFKTTVTTWNSIDIVINNAGNIIDRQWEQEILLNCNAMVRGTLLGLKYMGKDKGGNGGVIVNLGSNLSFQPQQYLSVYTGTKHFVLGFSRSLGTPYHYNRTGVKILTMCPGATDTLLCYDPARLPLNLSPDIGQDWARVLEENPPQPVENVAVGMVTLITKGDNGSAWMVENNEPIYELQIPDRRSFRKS